MILFKSRYPNKSYVGCMFNEHCEFWADERQADILRKQKDLITTRDIVEIIEEVKDEPINTGDETQTTSPNDKTKEEVQEVKTEEITPETPTKTDAERYAELQAIGWKHLNPEQKTEYQDLKAKLFPETKPITE